VLTGPAPFKKGNAMPNYKATRSYKQSGMQKSNSTYPGDMLLYPLATEDADGDDSPATIGATLNLPRTAAQLHPVNLSPVSKGGK